MDEVEQARHSRRELSLLMLIGGLVIALGACWVGFRLIIGRPLGKLLYAIRQSEKQSKACLVEHSANDELGCVLRAFNDMQCRLSAETGRVRQAFEGLDRVYNTTPALLCSTDDAGRINSVSDHWLVSTGYERNEVLDKPMSHFLTPGSLEVYDLSIVPSLARLEPVTDVPLALRRKDGADIDILLSAVSDHDPGRDSATTLCVMTDISALKAAERRLEHLALTDPLTDQLNRRGLLKYLDSLLEAKASQQSSPDRSIAAVMIIDLDNFKWINDTYGHDAGDRLLVAAAGRLRTCVRADEPIARIGGDEFALVCHHLESRAAIERLGGRLIECLEKPFALGGVNGFISASIGIALIDSRHETADEVLRLADLAMYRAKQRGKSTHVTYSEAIGQQVHETAKIREQIRHGLDHGWFSLCYQPIVGARTERIVGAEALLRLNCPEAGPVRPDLFVPVAEETGQIVELGTFALEQGLAALAKMRHLSANPDLYLAVNLSPRQLSDHLDAALDQALAIDPDLVHHLVLEITETMLLQRSDDIARRLCRLRERGTRIALDDFGTGYSSLSHIQQFPVDIIKIDKSFIGQLCTDGDAFHRPLAMVRATAAMAQELGIKIVAEGVEHESTVDLLRECGIDLFQGYLYAKPMPLDQLGNQLASRQLRKTHMTEALN